MSKPKPHPLDVMPLALQCKLGSILVHVDEGRTVTGHPFDWNAVDALTSDPEVRAWMRMLDKNGFLPRKR